MKIRWCAFTGALMLCFVSATYLHQAVSRDPPGVTTRWWDGTVSTKSVVYPDGKPRSFVQYGDDGETVLHMQVWNHNGVLIQEKIRKAEGTLEENQFSSDGKTLLRYRLWNGDENSYQLARDFYLDGKLQMEDVRTEDGTNTKRKRTFDTDGRLYNEYRILDNADQQTDNYWDGKLTSTSIFKANSDQVTISYYQDDGLPAGQMASRDTQVFWNHSSKQERFTEDGQLAYSLTTDNDSRDRAGLASIYGKGKLKYTQHFSSWELASTEEFSVDTGLLTRQIVLDPQSNRAYLVKLYRADGSLARTKSVREGKVVKQADYDSSGKDIVSEQQGGEPEIVAPKLLRPLPPFEGSRE